MTESITALDKGDKVTHRLFALWSGTVMNREYHGRITCASDRACQYDFKATVSWDARDLEVRM